MKRKTKPVDIAQEESVCLACLKSEIQYSIGKERKMEAELGKNF